MMPAALIHNPGCADTSKQLITRCEVCAAPNASFGIGAGLLRAMAAQQKGHMEQAKRHLGLWYCWEHWKKETE